MQSPHAQFKNLLKHLRTRRWESRTVKQSLGIAQKLQSKDDIMLSLLSLGNITRAKQDNKEAPTLVLRTLV
ncbi:hypothetical protein [Scytonema sp. HK-05]|uniref:hypothetical protein n=1 Tax=Scytonema sp. HK-05 TaxID=1137095 RepID=UPI000A5EA635|nr:hypothetical protein [Scytonema sp. HK-05]